MKRAFEHFFTLVQPKNLVSDRGREYYNSSLKQLFKKHSVNHYSTHSEMKVAPVESHIRWLRRKIGRFLQYFKTKKYIDVLHLIQDSYNNRVHSRTKMRPYDVTSENQHVVFDRLYGNQINKNQNRMAIGTKVRFLLPKKMFQKEYHPSFSEEIFTISKMLNTTPIVYKLTDQNGNELDGTFYNQELSEISEKNQTKILKYKNRSGRRFCLFQKKIMKSQFGFYKKISNFIYKKHFINK